MAEIDLAWSPSTDDVAVTGYFVERCEGVACVDFAQIATPSGTSYADTGLAETTLYRYRVAARDAAGNISDYSSIAEATSTITDVTPPSAPGTLTLDVVSDTAIDLDWVDATDNIAVTRYKVERCDGAACTDFVEIATPATNAYSDTGLTPDTLYRYRVRARDAANNIGSYTSIEEATTEVGEGPPLDYGTPTHVFGPGTYDCDALPTLNAGDVWEFQSGAIVTCLLDITVNDVVLYGPGTFQRDVETVQGFGDTIGVYGDDVTIDGITFTGGDIQLAAFDAARPKFLNTTHIDRSNAAMYLWGAGNVDAIISGFDIQPAAVAYTSAIGAQCDFGAAGVDIGPGTFDQGTDGHFGIELIEIDAPHIHDVSGQNGECLMSFPRCDNVLVENCNFDLRGMNSAFPANAGWGIEFTGATGCTATGNTFLGDSQTDNQHGVSLNTNANDVTVTGNCFRHLQAAVDGGGTGLVVTGNTLEDVCDTVAFAYAAPGFVDSPNTVGTCS